MYETNHNGGVPFAFGACHYKNAITNSTLKTPPSPNKTSEKGIFPGSKQSNPTSSNNHPKQNREIYSGDKEAPRISCQ